MYFSFLGGVFRLLIFTLLLCYWLFLKPWQRETFKLSFCCFSCQNSTQGILKVSAESVCSASPQGFVFGKYIKMRCFRCSSYQDTLENAFHLLLMYFSQVMFFSGVFIYYKSTQFLGEPFIHYIRLITFIITCFISS